MRLFSCDLVARPERRNVQRMQDVCSTRKIMILLFSVFSKIGLRYKLLLFGIRNIILK